MKRVVCPYHKERTPSCVLYSDHYRCYGCGKTGPLTDLKGVDISEASDPEPEDLEAAFAYIDQLPLKEIRGLSLPADDRAYFVPWPGKDYYKKRFFAPTRVKYFGAAGHKKPLFVANRVPGRALIVVEGEINALSIAKAVPEISVVSPGGSGDFSPKAVKKYWTVYQQYDILILLVDADKAGALACIEMLGALAGKGKVLKHHLMPQDANDLLVNVGSEGLRKYIITVLGTDLERSLTEGQVPA
jgi:hypothetical protein